MAAAEEEEVVVEEDEEVTGKEEVAQVVLTAWAATGLESLTREDLEVEAGITMVEWVVLGAINPSQLLASLQQSAELLSAEVSRLIRHP